MIVNFPFYTTLFHITSVSYCRARVIDICYLYDFVMSCRLFYGEKSRACLFSSISGGRSDFRRKRRPSGNSFTININIIATKRIRRNTHRRATNTYFFAFLHLRKKFKFVIIKFCIAILRMNKEELKRI